MSFIIKISNTSPQAASIINMLRTLARDYDFMQISEDSNILTNAQEKELNRRYEFVKKNPTLGKTWEEVENSL